MVQMHKNKHSTLLVIRKKKLEHQHKSTLNLLITSPHLSGRLHVGQVEIFGSNEGQSHSFVKIWPETKGLL